MRSVLIVITILLISGSIFSQENSDRYTLLNKQMLEAKKNGNEILHKQLSEEISNEFPVKNKSSRDASNMMQPVYPNGAPEPECNTDWGAGDVNVFGQVFTGEAVRTQRIVDLETDTNGVQYAAFVVSTRDTLKIFKSTNGGSNWFQLNSIFTFPGYNYQSFDMFITDSASVFKLGFSVIIRPFSVTNENTGEIFWFSVNNDGSAFKSVYVHTRAPNTGYKNPSLISDGYKYSTSLTYWYMAYIQVDSSLTSLTNQILLSYSTDWGSSWETFTVYSGMGPKYVSFNYNSYPGNNDSFYCAFSYTQLLPLPANSNIGLTRNTLLGFRTGVPWSLSTFGTSNEENETELAVNRKNNQMAMVYTENVSGIKTIRTRNFDYPSGVYFSNPVNLDFPTAAQTRPRLNCLEQEGSWRAAYVSTASIYDTVIYLESSNITAGFSGRTIVSAHNLTEVNVFPAVTGFKTSPGVFADGVLFIRRTTQTLWYDASNIFPLSVTNPNSIAGDYYLRQNYPNPFNPSTQIEYDLPKGGFVSLKVYDITGKQIAELVNQIQTAGHYKINFNASALSGGVYFYSLKAGDFSGIKKMVLLK